MNKEDYMREALKYAQEAYLENEVPIGAVIVKDEKVIAHGRNRREFGKNALYHAEIEAIDMACKVLDGWRLINCDMYVTLEPCPMCAGAIVNSRLRKLYFGAYDKNNGCCGSIDNILTLINTYRVEYEGGILKDECQSILTDFFKNLRK